MLHELNHQAGCRYDLWDCIISFLFIKNGPVYPLLNEVIKEELKHLSYIFREFNQLLVQLPHKYFQVTSLSWE